MINIFYKEEATMALKAVGKAAKPVIVPTKDDVERMALEYLEVSGQISKLEETKKALSEKIKSAVKQIGVKDDKGSSYLNTGKTECGAVLAVSSKLNEGRALKFLHDNKLDGCIKTVEKVDEKAFETAFKEGRITDAEVVSLTDTKETFRVSVKPVAEMPVVQEAGASGKSVLKAAASRKGR